MAKAQDSSAVGGVPGTVAIAQHGPCQSAGGEEGPWDSPSHPMTMASHFFCLGRAPAPSGLNSRPIPVILLPSNSTAARLQPMRGHPTAEMQSPMGRLTMQGVGQHAGHALHHHLIGGLQESRGRGLGLACLWNWCSRGAISIYRGKTGILQHPCGVGLPQMAPLVTHAKFPLPRTAASSQARSRGG